MDSVLGLEEREADGQSADNDESELGEEVKVGRRRQIVGILVRTIFVNDL